jgi:archaetidylinositol phosphate synthase
MAKERGGKEKFDGYSKDMDSFLQVFERKWKPWLVSKMPGWLEGSHLTLSTLLWSALIVLFSYLARHNIKWLWLVSLMIFLQYITDSIDGLLGKERKRGLAKWGYYMDHFMDYVFLSSIVIGYYFIVDAHFRFMMILIFAILGGYLVHGFLYFSVTGKFRITYMRIGPSEIRFVFIIINTLLIIFGRTYMGPALPYALVITLLGLVIVVYDSQKEIWKMDKKNNVDKE